MEIKDLTNKGVKYRFTKVFRQGKWENVNISSKDSDHENWESKIRRMTKIRKNLIVIEFNNNSEYIYKGEIYFTN